MAIVSTSIEIAASPATVREKVLYIHVYSISISISIALINSTTVPRLPLSPDIQPNRLHPLNRARRRLNRSKEPESRRQNPRYGRLRQVEILAPC